jgi:hypothetical protein
MPIVKGFVSIAAIAVLKYMLMVPIIDLVVFRITLKLPNIEILYPYKTGNVRINVKLRRVRVTTVAVEKLYIIT